MADMTAEQLRAELVAAAEEWKRAAENSEAWPLCLRAFGQLNEVASRLASVSQLIADREVAVAQAVEFAEYVERAAKGTMVERAQHFLSVPYAAELRARLSGMAAVPADRVVVPRHLPAQVAALVSVTWTLSHEQIQRICDNAVVTVAQYEAATRERGHD